MSKMQMTAASAFAVALLGSVASANAGVVVANFGVGGAPTSGVFYETFESLPLGSTGGTLANGLSISFQPNAQVVQGSLSGQYAAPFLSGANGAGFGLDGVTGPDPSKYLAAGNSSTNNGASITFTFDVGQQYFGLLWGSVDDFNTLTFYDEFDNVISVITGTDAVTSANDNGDQGVNGTFYVNLTSDVEFYKVVATSSQSTFEIDNVAFGADIPSVPEPASLAMLGLGLLGVGAVTRRRRKA